MTDNTPPTVEQKLQNPEAQKNAAEEFLSRLRKHLNDKIRPQRVAQWIQEKGRIANEGLFLDEFVLPAIPEFLGHTFDSPMDVHDERIRRSFLAESTR